MAADVVRQCRPALGTLIEIAIPPAQLPQSDARRQALFERAFSAIRRVEQEMSFHAPDSALSRLNRTRAGASIRLPAGCYEVLEIARAIHLASAGMFDCGVGDRLVRAGMLPCHGGISAPEGSSSIAGLQLQGDGVVTLLRPTCIDLGGIAKGYAVDQAVEALASAGIHQCSINAGGDLRLLGSNAQEIFVRHPAAPGLAVLLGQLADGAVATSAPYHSLQGTGRQQRCALFDPDGRSLTAPLSYTVLAPRCVIADALTKAVAVAWHRQQRTLPAAASSPLPLAFAAAFLTPFEAQAFILQPPART